MNRALGLVVHNWPLKLGAVVLSTLLYAGLVVSSSTQPFEGAIPIEATGVSEDVTILSDLGVVRSVRYVAPEDLGLRLDSSSFEATVDLAEVDPATGRVSVAVDVTAVDPRVQVLDFEPRQIVVELDVVTSRTVPVRAVLGPVPSGLEVGDPVVDETTATVTGAKSIVDRVAEVVARISVDASGIDVSRTVDLEPVDASGEPLTPIDVEPATTRVRVPVFSDRQTKTLSIHPDVVGSPAAGFEVAGVSVDPLVVAVEGDVDDLLALEVADTAPVSVAGATSNVVAETALALPDGVQLLGNPTITVTVILRPVTGSRNFEAGLLLVGARSDREYALSADNVLATIGGSIADLDRLSGAALTLTLDVSGLDTGSHEVQVTANLQTGLTLLAVAPDPIVVTITNPGSSPSPGP